jgi:nitrate reductase gamma subunit
MGLVQLWTYVAVAAFVVGCAYKALRFATMPLHVRWELYPVAHEKGRASYGGSYFEELDWWTKPREISRFGEVKTIAEEVLTLKQVREHNPGLWLPSLLFHYGLYLLFALGTALLLGAIPGVRRLPGLWRLEGGRALAAWGGVALALASLGCVALLVRRLSRGDLRRASTPADFFHLWLLLAVFGASWASFVAVDHDFALTAGFLSALLTFRVANPLPFAPAMQLVLLGIFLAYLPWSHMTHFFAKYFTWHSVRWDDAPNLGSKYDKSVEKLLLLPISWSAPHIKGDGRKTWADVATEGGKS